MTRYVALLRAVNVGGTGKLPMPALRAMCQAAGFRDVRTYIASGNVVFASDEAATAVKASLAQALEAYAGRPVGVLVRTGTEMAKILAANPFPLASPNRTVVIFLDDPPSADALAQASGRRDEEIVPGKREIYVHYPGGIGRSKLTIPAAQFGTARNMNTVATLADWATP